MKSLRQNIYLVVLLVLLIFFPRCQKNEEPIPYTYVNFYINLNSPQYTNLTSVGGWVYVQGGYRGILVYRSSTEDFKAFDRACTYKPSSSCERIQVEENSITLVDTCCGSRFLITDGSVVNGPATISLREYRTYISGQALHVTNY